MNRRLFISVCAGLLVWLGMVLPGLAIGDDKLNPTVVQAATILRKLQGRQETLMHNFPLFYLQFPPCPEGSPSPLFPSDSFFASWPLNPTSPFNYLAPTDPLLATIANDLVYEGIGSAINEAAIPGSEVTVDTLYFPPRIVDDPSFQASLQMTSTVGDFLSTVEFWLPRMTSFVIPFDGTEDSEAHTITLTARTNGWDGDVVYYARTYDDNDHTGHWVPVGSGPIVQISWDTYDTRGILCVLHAAPFVRVDRVACQCACNSNCPAGTSDFHVGSVDVMFSLGKRDARRSAGHLYIHSPGQDPAIATRAGISPDAITQIDNPSTVVQDEGGLRQIATPLTLVDLVDVTVPAGHRYEIRFYPLPNDGPDTEGLYHPVVGTEDKTIVVEDPDGTLSTLRFTEIESGISKVTEYQWNAGAAQWALSKGDGASMESLEVTWNVAHTERTEIREVRDSLGVLVSARSDVFQIFPWGEELVSSTLDPDGQALTTTRSYYDDAVNDGASYARLKSVLNPDGSWVRYTYDATSRLFQEIRPFGQQTIAAPTGDCRVTTYTYQDAQDTETIVVTVQNQEVERRYVVGENSNHVKEIVCTQPGAAVNDATNLVTETYYTTVTGSRQVSTIRRPDGTMTIYDYGFDANGNPTTTLYTGAPNAGGTAIVSGTASTTVTDNHGYLLSESTTDIESGLLLTQATVTAWNAHGDPTHIDYEDNTTEESQYAGCCGQASSRTSREGITTGYTYDALGNVSSETRAGVTMLTTYDPLGRPLTVTREGSAGGQIVLEQNEYNIAGQLASHRDAMDRETTYVEGIDNGYWKRTTTNPDGTTRVETRNSDGTPREISGTAVHPAKYEYGVDAAGLFTKRIRVGDGGAETEWVKSYVDFAGRPSRTVYADDAESQTFYNAAGQMTKQVDPDGVTTLFTYNTAGEQNASALDINRNGTIDAGDRVTQMVSSVTQRDGKTVQRKTTSVSAAAGGTIEAGSLDTTPNGRESWQTSYGQTTHMLTTLQPASATRTEVVTRPDASSQVTEYDLDRVTSITVKDSTGAMVTARTLAYDEYGRLESSTDARTGTTSYTYTSLDEKLTETTPPPVVGQAGLTTTNHYDSSRRIDWVQLPDGSQKFNAYLATGELWKSYGSQTYTTEYSYDAQGRVKTLQTTGAAGLAVTTWNYSSTRGFLTSKTYADGQGPAYPEYTPAGRLQKRHSVRGIDTTMTYNNAGELATITYSDGTPAVTYTYDAQGRRATISDASGNRTLSYTDNGQLIAETYTGGTLAGLATTRSYDAQSRRDGLTVTLPGQTLAQTYGYDLAGRLQSITADTEVATYHYLPNSNLLSSTVFQHSGTTVLTQSRAYDANDRLTGMSAVSGTLGAVSSYGYQMDQLGRRTRIDLADNSSWRYEYDALGQVSSGKHYWSDDSEVAGQQYGYTFDGIGNRVSTTVNGRPAAYTPNLINQYTQRIVPGAADVIGTADAAATVTVNNQPTLRKGEYFYKELAAGNSTSPVNLGVTVNGVRNNAGPAGEDAVTTQSGHIYVGATPESFSYDTDGNQTGDGRWIYTWDGENRLNSMETTAAAVAAGVTQQRLEFAYDEQGRRVDKKVFTWDAVAGAWQLASELRFLYDGWNLVAELDETSQLVRSYVWGLDLSNSLAGAGGVGGLLVVHLLQPASGSTLLPTYDGNGNVTGLVDASNGTPVASYEYGPFGEVIRNTGFAYANPVRFSTKYQDEETGLLYYGYRYYQPQTGQWINRDPIQESGGCNLYGFVQNQPTERVDALGLYVPMTVTFGPGGSLPPGVTYDPSSKKTYDSNWRKYPPPYDDQIDWLISMTLNNFIVNSVANSTVGTVAKCSVLYRVIFESMEQYEWYGTASSTWFSSTINYSGGRLGADRGPVITKARYQWRINAFGRTFKRDLPYPMVHVEDPSGGAPWPGH